MFGRVRDMVTKAAGGGEPKSFPVQKTDEEWQKILGQQEFQVLRRAGTEPAGTGKYNTFYPEKGHFACGGCNAPMYSASSKFKDSGWIAFEKCYHDGDLCHVGVKPDWGSLEIFCNLCGGHLGHVFYGEQQTCTNERH